MLPDFAAVILDLDGLTLDTESTYSYAWKQAAKEFGVQLDEEFCHRLFGRHADDVMQALAGKIGSGFDRSRFYELAAAFWRTHVAAHGIGKMPGLDGLLDILVRERIPYALATNSDGPYARECLRVSGVSQRFPMVVTRDQVAKGKPAPDLVLEAAKRLDAPPGRCLVLEDSETGLLAARSAGALPVLVLSEPAAPAHLKNLALEAFPSLIFVAAAIERSPSDVPSPRRT